MTREEAIDILKTFMENPLFSDAHKQVFNIAIHDIKQRHDWDINNLILINKDDYEPLEQEPCEDAVSRKSVITIIQNHWWNCRDIDKLVNELPSITPIRPKGHWIDREIYDADRWKCSECGRTEPYKENYCPNCGAKMESEEK